jgi:hypothetical protein
MENDSNNNDMMSNNDFMQIIDDLALMESRITVLEDNVNQIKAKNQEKNNTLLEDCIIIGSEQYICMKYIRKEPCIVKNYVRKIGFDVCIDDEKICPWAFKIEDNNL